LPLRRLCRLTNLKRVWLYGVNQKVLDDIVQFSKIESLYIEGLTATNLEVLSRLPDLRRLILAKGTRIQNLDWVVGLPSLESLAIQNARHVSRLDPLASLTKLSERDQKRARLGKLCRAPLQLVRF